MTTNNNRKSTTKSSTMSLASKKMHRNKRLKKNTKNSLNNSTPIKKPVTSKSSNNSMKPMKHSGTPKKEECTTSTELKGPKAPAKTISLTCSSEEEGEEELPRKNKPQKSNLPKRHSQSLFRTFIMEKSSKCNIAEHAAVRNVAEREDKTLKSVNSVKAKVWLSKCTKWVQACINKSKNIVISVKEKDKLSLKVENASNARVKKFCKRKRLSKFQLKKVFRIITLFRYPVKGTKYLMLWQEI